MGVLEEVTQLKKTQTPDDEIIGNLQERGYTPKAIDEALNQSQVKEAVSKEEETPQEENVPRPQEDAGGMQQSIMGRGETDLDYPPPQQGKNYKPGAQEMAPPEKPQQEQQKESPPPEAYDPQEDYPQEEYGSQQGYDPQEYSPQGDYSQDGYADYSSGLDTDTMVEIAEQIFSKQNRKMEIQMDGLNDFKNFTQAQVEHLTERIKRIESTMDKLQAAILEKIGSYGNNLESIKKEMSMIENSFNKVLTRKHPVHHKPVKKVAKKKSHRKR